MQTLVFSNKPPPPDEYLTAEEVLELQGILRSQAADILNHGRQAVTELTEVKPVDPDALDLAVSESNREFSLRLADRERRMLKKIERSLQRIEDGEYGACESCGVGITYKRLLARPVASQCIDCKTEAEQLEPKKKLF